MNRSLRTAAFFLAVLPLVVVMAPPIHADSGYRYWTYWTVSKGQWLFSPVGPAAVRAVDGDVQGWRFAVTTNASSSTEKPRTAPTTAFSRLCDSFTAPAGSVRVALIIDTGTRENAPDGQSPPPARGACAIVEDSATGADALMAVASPNVQDGLICAIDSYPQGECAVSVEVVTPIVIAPPVDILAEAPSNSTSSVESGSPVQLIGVGVLLAFGLATGWLIRRRR